MRSNCPTNILPNILSPWCATGTSHLTNSSTRGDADIILANARRYRKEPYIVSENIVNYNRIRAAMHSDSVGLISMKQLEREGAVFKPGDYSAFYFLDGDTINTSFMEF